MAEIIYQSCKCGKVIKGTSENQVKYNMQTHLRSNRHKRGLQLQEYSICKRCGSKTGELFRIKKHHKNFDRHDESKNNIAYLCTWFSDVSFITLVVMLLFIVH